MPYLQLCSEEQLRKIHEEFNLTEESLQNGVEHLINWLEKTSHLPNITDKEWLGNVLLAHKNSLERAKSFLDYYYVRRTLRQDYFAHRDPGCEEMIKVRQDCFLVPMPKLTPECYRLMIFRSMSEKPTSMDKILSFCQLCSDILLKMDKTKGCICIVDLNKSSDAWGTVFSTNVKLILEYMQIFPRVVTSSKERK